MKNRLSPDAVSDFTLLYQEKLGMKLTPENAELKAIELLEFLKVIYRPIKVSKLKQETTNEPVYQKDKTK